MGWGCWSAFSCSSALSAWAAVCPAIWSTLGFVKLKLVRRSKCAARRWPSDPVKGESDAIVWEGLFARRCLYPPKLKRRRKQRWESEKFIMAWRTYGGFDQGWEDWFNEGFDFFKSCCAIAPKAKVGHPGNWGDSCFLGIGKVRSPES